MQADHRGGYRGGAPSTVLFVSLSGWLAGPGRSLATVLTYLPDDLDAVVACPDIGNLRGALTDRRPGTRLLSLPRKPGQRSDPVTRLKAVVTLAVWMRRHRRELLAVHANGLSDLHVAAPGVILSRVRVVVWLHGSEANPWDHRLGALWKRLLTNRASYVAVSDVARRRAADSGIAEPERIGLIPNPVDPTDVLAERRAAIPDEPTILSRIPSGRVVCGYLGGARRIKGFFDLPDLADRLQGSNVTLALCDQPSDTDTPEERAVWDRLQAPGRTVVALGHVDDIRRVYSSFDMTIALSKAEAHPRAVTEPMLNGIPVIATDIEAHRDLLGDNQAGLLFPPGDMDRAAKAVLKLAADKYLRQSLGDEGRARAVAFRPEAIIPRLVSLYRG